MKYFTGYLTGALLLSQMAFAAASNDRAQDQASGLNLYCDPIGTMYLGGTPLFDEATGERISREEYLATQGLNLYCDPIETAYAGGNPLFDEETGESLSLEEYLARKSYH